MKKIQNAIKPFSKKDLPDIHPGDTVKVFQRIPARIAKQDITGGPASTPGQTAADEKKKKEKIHIFEGVVISRKHGKEIGATITVRKVISGIGVERIFPLHLPTIKKIEIIKRSKVRRAKLYYLRKAKGKRARLKRKEFTKAIVDEKPKESLAEELKEEISEEKIEEKQKETKEAESK